MDKFSIRDFLIGGLVFKALGDALGKRRYGTLLFLILVVIILFVLYWAFRLLKWVVFEAIPAFAQGVKEGAEEVARDIRQEREAKAAAAAAAAQEEAARLAARRYYANEEGLFELTSEVVEIDSGEAYVRVDEISDDAFGSLDVESIQPIRSMAHGGKSYALGEEVFEIEGYAGRYVQMSSLMPALKPGRFVSSS